ncbi:25101_t:CDS:1 [Racocetra persica]|uniref:25101_t:CDS:1 n=1 Tax=Racocetra persica TaxID=160502 RepID=A0ACA9MWX2_9GLOM|nr:25101_t:CDS:1 [Racocetra persica]
MSYAGVLSFICEEKNRNVQGFDHVTFLIKVEQEDDNQAIFYFLDNDLITECDIPEGIKIIELNENGTTRIKNPFRRTHYFLLNHPKKYEVYYNEKKIYALISEQKRYAIYNYIKSSSLKQYELEKCINKALNVIIKLEDN